MDQQTGRHRAQFLLAPGVVVLNTLFCLLPVKKKKKKKTTPSLRQQI